MFVYWRSIGCLVWLLLRCIVCVIVFLIYVQLFYFHTINSKLTIIVGWSDTLAVEYGVMLAALLLEIINPN